ncbi:MAG: Spy/CpxP family protein refolding chaperone [Lautropia sp.]
MRFRKTIIGSAIVAAALGAATLGSAWAHGGRGGEGAFFGMGEGGWHQRDGGRQMDPAKMQARLERGVGYMVWNVGGTTEQRDKIVAIAKSAMTEVAELRKQRADMRAQGLALLKAPTIDRAAIEKLRTDGIALADAASKRMSQAMADAAEVLTPEQRVKLAERIEARGKGRHGDGHRGEGRRGEGRGHGEGRGMGPGQGMGQGQGMGPGQGQGMGPGQGMGQGRADGAGPRN